MNSENPESAPQAVRFQDAQAMYNQGQLETKGEKSRSHLKEGNAWRLATAVDYYPVLYHKSETER